MLMVTRLDRLARSTRDLLNTLAAIADRKAGFRSLGDTWADTTTSHGRLMLTVLGGLAEFERDLIRTRTGEGRTRAKARGVKLGRKPKLTLHQKREAIARRERGDETLAEIGRHLVAWIQQESSRIKHLWRLTDSEVSSLLNGLAYPCNKVTGCPSSSGASPDH